MSTFARSVLALGVLIVSGPVLWAADPPKKDIPQPLP